MDARHYAGSDRSCDWIVRCEYCRRLVLGTLIRNNRTCECGSRRFIEILSLNTREWLKIRLGILDFPQRREFLAEFPTFKDRMKMAWYNIFGYLGKIRGGK